MFFSYVLPYKCYQIKIVSCFPLYLISCLCFLVDNQPISYLILAIIYLHICVVLTVDSAVQVYPRRNLKELIPNVASLAVRLILNLLTCIYLLFTGLRRYFIAQGMKENIENQTKSQLPHSNAQDESILQAVKEDSIHPCWERLQNLEALVSELVKKPKKMPPEKDDILRESLSRIRSIEQDLQKTKKVSFLSFCSI